MSRTQAKTLIETLSIIWNLMAIRNVSVSSANFCKNSLRNSSIVIELFQSNHKSLLPCEREKENASLSRDHENVLFFFSHHEIIAAFFALVPFFILFLHFFVLASFFCLCFVLFRNSFHVFFLLCFVSSTQCRTWNRNPLWNVIMAENLSFVNSVVKVVK